MKPILLGFTQADPYQKPQPMYLDYNDGRWTHGLAFGKPASGKTKWIECLERQRIKHYPRCASIKIDPHGASHDDSLRWCAYNNYTSSRDVVVLDPSRGQFLKGFNPFRPIRGMDLSVQVNGMVSALLRVWDAKSTVETPTLARTMRCGFAAAIIRKIPFYDLFHVFNFNEGEVREDLIRSITEPIVRDAWEEIQELKKIGDWHAEVLSLRNRLYPLVSSPVAKRLMGVFDDSFNLDLLDAMNKGKIVLINLKPSREFDAETSTGVGALMVHHIFQTSVMYREGTSHSPCFLYLDEFQKFRSPDLIDILGESRKFNLAVTLATQDLASIRDSFSPEVVSKLMTCCGIKAVFGGLNREDADRMVGEMAIDLLDLNETKYILESTKFWPIYTRDKVYSGSTFWSNSQARSRGKAQAWSDTAGQYAGDSSAAAHQWSGTEGWFSSPTPAVYPNTSTTAVTHGDSRLSVKSGTESEAESTGAGAGGMQAVSDVPILMPVPFQEITSRTTYSLEEQTRRMSDRMMHQYQRHCFLKLPGRLMIPLAVPYVHKPYVLPSVLAKYEAKLAQKNGALRPEEVDALLASQPTLFSHRNRRQYLKDALPIRLFEDSPDGAIAPANRRHEDDEDFE